MPLMRALVATAVLLLGAACNKPTAATHLDAAKEASFRRKPDVALSEYKLALDALERDDSAQGQVYRARALRGAADTYFLGLQDYKRAVEVYKELITRCPEAPETLEGRLHLASLLEHEFRDLRGAIAELTAAMARNPPQSAELAYKVATLYFELQDYGQCELEAAQVARRYESSSFVDDALYLRGQALSMIEGRRDAARASYQELIDRFADSELRPHALFELGRLTAEAGDPEKAIEYFVLALKTHPRPQVVQDAIRRVRARLRATTPRAVGDASKAFDWDVPGNAVVERPMPKTSVEAVGGTQEEAEREAKMKPEVLPAADAKPARGEGSL
jgi:tetratricopeptide (TPR) repeat protein